MATDKYPHRNVNMPMDEAALARVRAELSSEHSMAPAENLPSGGKGSRRQTKPGEWVDDRKIDIGGPAIPSKDSPPVWEERDEKAARSVTYNENYYYQVILSKGCVVDGRVLAPGKSYVMNGATLNTITDSVMRADNIADYPQGSQQ